MDTLTVKWYLNDYPEPVYQWVYNRKPRALGRFLNKINIHYRASRDKYSEHRALEILNPTTQESGVYKCQVGTLDENSEDTKSKNLIIYCK